MTLALAFLGFGKIPRSFLEILKDRPLPVPCRVTGIATGCHGAIADPAGLDLSRVEHALARGASLSRVFCEKAVHDAASVLDRSQADVILLATPLNPLSGEPGLSLARRALSQGKHVITADKGPVALAFGELSSLAAQKNVAFLYEGVVMDGLPLFSLKQRLLSGVRIEHFRGVINSTPGVVIRALEEGRTFQEGVAEAVRLGIAEANPSLDLEGFDAQLKACILANALLAADLRPDQVARTPLREIAPEEIARARQEGKVLRFVAEAKREDVMGGAGWDVSVGPRWLLQEDVLAATSGSSSTLVLGTDLLGGITLGIREPGLLQSAYAFHLDLCLLCERLR